MVSSPHEALHRIFRADPGLFARLLPRAGIGFPEHTAIEPLDTDLTEIRPLERRVDSLFRVHAAGEEGGFLLAVESQGKPDPDKHNSWTYYLAHMYAKYRLPPFLRWCARTRQPRRGHRNRSVSAEASTRAWSSSRWSWDLGSYP
ncbi:hypothetical protein [Streptomyces lanatus]|uniref:Transposase (putative) YhgA-like domain-containing protein n=1 Tax=Streptomyces lanatus TaxID=66900 RepID=A0ABV1XSX4_9ACTN|nr:hypothetical protein [Streptomyces lanatus]